MIQTAFESILRPIGVDEFVREYWCRRPLHIRSDDARRFQQYFSWESLTRLITYHKLDESGLRLAQSGRLLAPDENRRLAHWWNIGATIAARQLHQRLPALAALRRALQLELGHTVNINGYASKPEHRGFPVHYDPHEVFILQVDGHKEWDVFCETVRLPIQSQRSAALTPPSSAPLLTCTLGPGDVLYIPRGHWHSGVARLACSLHLTVGVICTTPVDFLKWLSDEMAKRERWRVSLPLTRNGDFAEASTELASLIGGLLASGELRDLTERFLAQRYVGLKPSRQVMLPRVAADDVLTRGMETRFWRSRVDASPIAGSSATQHFITIGDRQIVVDNAPDKLLSNLLQQASFTAATIAEWAPELNFQRDIVPLLCTLIEEGLLVLQPVE